MTGALRCANTAEALYALLDTIEAAALELPAPPKTARRIRLLIEELAGNAVHYGYPDGCEGAISVWLLRDGEEVLCTVIDDGIAFDPLAAAAPDLTATIDDRPVGGLGIHLVRSLVHDVRYERSGGRNRIDLRLFVGA